MMTRRNHCLWLSAFSLLLASGDGSALTGGKSEADQAREKCAASGKLVSGGPYKTRGLFVDGPDLTDPMLRAARLLGEQRLSFVEFKRRPKSPNTMPKNAPRWVYQDFAEDLVGPERDEPYVRLSIAPITDARCLPFKRKIEQARFLAMSYRWAGVSPDLCVAVERVVEPASTMERVFVPDEPESKTTFSGWFVLRDRAKKGVHARVWTDGGRYCENREEYEGLVKLVEGPGSPLLGVLPNVIDVESAEFPTRINVRIAKLGPEIPDPTGSTEWKARFEGGPVRHDDLKAFGKLIDNAQTSLEAYYERHTIPNVPGVGTALAGYRLFIVRPGMRKRVRLVDGSNVFNDCDRLRREGRLLIVECRSERPFGELGKGRWGSWVLTYQDDGTPFRIFSVDLGSTDGRRQVMDAELVDGVPAAALLYTSESTPTGVRRVWNKATLELKK